MPIRVSPLIIRVFLSRSISRLPSLNPSLSSLNHSLSIRASPLPPVPDSPASLSESLPFQSESSLPLLPAIFPPSRRPASFLARCEPFPFPSRRVTRPFLRFALLCGGASPSYHCPHLSSPDPKPFLFPSRRVPRPLFALGAPLRRRFAPLSPPAFFFCVIINNNIY